MTTTMPFRGRGPGGTEAAGAEAAPGVGAAASQPRATIAGRSSEPRPSSLMKPSGAPTRIAPVIAIDGPSGAGKGSVSRAVAATLGCRYIDTGAMYRAVAWLAAHRGLALDDEPGVRQLAEGVDLTQDGATVTVAGHDVTHEIRNARIDAAAARVARMPSVRAVLVGRQRAYASAGGLVMEGRDIGTAVFPNADVKIYLDAAPEERAARRAADPAHGLGRGASRLSDVASALEARDRSDRTRDSSPLVKADDAVRVDTTGLVLETVIERVLTIVRGRLAVRGGRGPSR